MTTPGRAGLGAWGSTAHPGQGQNQPGAAASPRGSRGRGGGCLGMPRGSHLATSLLFPRG